MNQIVTYILCAATALMLVLAIVLRKMLSTSTERDAAVKLGFTVEDVEREYPVIDENRKTLISLEKEKCAKYNLSQPAEQKGDWSLLQRFPRKDPPLPNGFIVVAPRVTEDLLQTLKPLAEQFGDDFYEFERKGDTLSVFWWESGGKDAVQKIYNALCGLKGA